MEQARRRDSLEVRKQRKRPLQNTEEAPHTGEEPGQAASPRKKLKITNAASTEKQALLRTVAVGGVLQGSLQAVKKLAETVGKVHSLKLDLCLAIVWS